VALKRSSLELYTFLQTKVKIQFVVHDSCLAVCIMKFFLTVFGAVYKHSFVAA